MAMTMLQMSGVQPTPATMADGVLLIVDAQREYTDGLLPLTGVQPAVEALAVLLEKARAAGAPVVHVRHQSKGKAFNPASTGYEIVKELTPRAGETIIDKGLPNSFAGTEGVRQAFVDDRLAGELLRQHRSCAATDGDRPQEPAGRRLHDPHVHLGDGAVRDRPRLYVHRRGRYGGDARPARCDGHRHGLRRSAEQGDLGGAVGSVRLDRAVGQADRLTCRRSRPQRPRSRGRCSFFYELELTDEGAAVLRGGSICLPTWLMATIAATAINEAMRVYSTVVAPRSLRARRVRIRSK